MTLDERNDFIRVGLLRYAGIANTGIIVFYVFKYMRRTDERTPGPSRRFD